tara:strand:+ start:299 stop:439 length:141 start_codon:yes stop_codon:yes gene_type:complete
MDNEKIKKQKGVLSVEEIKNLVKDIFKKRKKDGKMVSGQKQKHGQK